MGEVNETRPLWKFVKKINPKKGGGGGNAKIQCNFCPRIFTGSYTRVKAHLLKDPGSGVEICKGISDAKLEELKNLDCAAEIKIQQSKSKEVSLPPPSSEMVDPKKRKTSGQASLEDSFNNQGRQELDSEIARMFYSAGLSFNFAKNTHYRKAFDYACSNHLSRYKAPGYNKLRTTLLDKERAHVETLLAPIKKTWSTKGVTIVSDGWSDPQRRSLINFLAVTEKGPMFLKAFDCSGAVKSKEFIAQQIKDVIMEVGPSNVVQIVTDNAPVCKAAGLIIESEFPSIFWTPCVVHTLNLALKNICALTVSSVQFEECVWIARVHEDAVLIKNFIVNHSMRNYIFNSHNHLKLLTIAQTRFASTLVMLKRFRALKKGLQEMVICDQWSTYKDDDVDMAKLVKEILLDDDWWDKLDYILAFTNPIYDVLRKTDTDSSTLHKVYEMWDSMIEEVKSIIYKHEKKALSDHSPFFAQVNTILLERWTKSSTPLHCLAHSLNPSPEWLSEDPMRVPPHHDKEVTSERKKCFLRYFSDVDEKRKASLEFANFTDGRGEFDDIDALNDRGKIDAKSWWILHGSSAPILQKIAFKLLAQPCSSPSCERNWSTYSFIHSLKRNKLAPQRAEKLVYIHSNLRLLSRNSSQYHTEDDTKNWDIAGDEFGALDESESLLVANLSLDEPELEGVLFKDDDVVME